MLQSKPFESSSTSALSAFQRLSSALVVPLLVALALFFRLWDLGQMRHGYDMSQPIWQALQMIELRRLFLTGPISSVFLDHPALISYQEVLPLLVSRSPWSVYIFVAALNALAIPFIYRVTARFFGPTHAAIAALLFATNPWIVYYSRTPWPPAFISLYMAVTAWGLWPVAEGRLSRPRVTVAALAFAATAQSHLQSFFVAVFQVFPILFLFRRRVPWRPVFVVAGILAVAFLLYGLGIFRIWQAQDFKWNYFFTGGERHWRIDTLFHAIRMVSGWNFDYVYSRTLDDYPARHFWSMLAHGFLTLALLGGLIRAAIIVGRRQAQTNIAAILLIWFLAPLVTMTISRHEIHPYYLLITLPAGQVLAAWGLSPLLERRGLRQLTFAAIATITFLFGLNFYRANQEAALSPTPATWEGWTLEAGTQVGTEIREMMADNPPPRYVISVEEPTPLRAESAILSSFSGTVLEVEERLMEAPLTEFAYLREDEPVLYVYPHRASTEETRAHFPTRDVQVAGGAIVSLVRVPSYQELTTNEPSAVDLAWPSAAGLSLLRYVVPQTGSPGGMLNLTTYWRVDTMPADPTQTFVGAFYHLVDQQGIQTANISGHGLWGYQWQQGDIYVEHTRIPIPPDLASGQYNLLIGLFDTIHARNYDLLAPEGPQYALTIPVTIQ